MSIGKLNYNDLQEEFVCKYAEINNRLPSKQETIVSKHELAKAVHNLKREVLKIRKGVSR